MPAPRGPLEHEVRGAFAAKLGVDANADVDTFNAAFDKRMHEERLHGAIAQKLGLDPFQTSGADILATVDERLDARAKAVGLPVGAKVADIEAAEAEAAAKRPTPTPAASTPVAPRVPATMTQDDEDAAIDVVVDALIRNPGAGSSNGRVVGEPSSVQQSSAWK